MRVFVSGVTDTLKQFRAYLTPVEASYCVFYFSDDPNNEITDELVDYIQRRMEAVSNIFCLFEDGYFERQYTLYEFDLIRKSFLAKTSGTALISWLKEERNISRVRDVPVSGGATWEDAVKMFREKFFR
jgi:hypothetical protein